MGLLDASVLLALLRDEPAPAEVETLIREGEAAISAANVGGTEAIGVVALPDSSGGKPDHWEDQLLQL